MALIKPPSFLVHPLMLSLASKAKSTRGTIGSNRTMTLYKKWCCSASYMVAQRTICEVQSQVAACDSIIWPSAATKVNIYSQYSFAAAVKFCYIEIVYKHTSLYWGPKCIVFHGQKNLLILCYINTFIIFKFIKHATKFICIVSG